MLKVRTSFFSGFFARALDEVDDPAERGMPRWSLAGTGGQGCLLSRNGPTWKRGTLTCWQATDSTL